MGKKGTRCLKRDGSGWTAAEVMRDGEIGHFFEGGDNQLLMKRIKDKCHLLV